MVIYAESSAVVAWLLNEPRGPSVLRAMHAAERVVSASLTSLECARALARARTDGRVTHTQELAALQLFDEAESSWIIQELDARVLARAREPMPGDPVRPLDALHIAAACVLRDGLGPITMLSLDDRVRLCASGLGFTVVP